MPGFELFDAEEKNQVNQVMETGILMRYGFAGLRAGRYKAKEMEALISAKTGARHALLLSSGTAALTTALAAMGVGAGHEVIMPSFTFVATFESIIQLGAIPVVVDVDESLCLSPKAVEAAITPKTKVVLPVHMCGAAARMDELTAICQKHGLLLLEDACQAFGASYKGKMLGALGLAGCYSFDFNKIVTCGEGGAVVTSSPNLYARADMYHDHGHDHSNDDRGAEGHPIAGYNYRISELNAAVGCAQMGKLDKMLSIQRANKKIIKDALRAVPEVTFRHLPDEAGDSATFLCFFMPNTAAAQKAAAALKAGGVDGTFYWYANNWHYIRNWEHFKNNAYAHPLHQEPLEAMRGYATADFSASDRVMERLISLNIKLGWSREETAGRAQKVVAAVKSAL